MNDATDMLDYDMLSKTIINTNKDLDSIVKRDLRTVEELDSQIVRLVYERNCILHGLNCKCLAHNNAETCLLADPNSIWEEYKNEGFKGDTVKSAVKIIRSLFFNDTLEEFRKFFCTQVIYDQYGIRSDSIGFLFEDVDGHAMMFSFNLNGHQYDELCTHKMLNGRTYLKVKINGEYRTICMSFDINEMKRSVEKWISDGFVAKPLDFDNINLLERINQSFNEFQNYQIFGLFSY